MTDEMKGTKKAQCLPKRALTAACVAILAGSLLTEHARANAPALDKSVPNDQAAAAKTSPILADLLMTPFLGTHAASFLGPRQQYCVASTCKSLLVAFAGTPRADALKELHRLVGDLILEDAEGVRIAENPSYVAEVQKFWHDREVTGRKYYALTQVKAHKSPSANVYLQKGDAEAYLAALQRRLDQLWPQAYPGQKAPTVSYPTKHELAAIYGAVESTVKYAAMDPWDAASKYKPYRRAFSSDKLTTNFWIRAEDGKLISTGPYQEMYTLVLPIFRFTKPAADHS